MRYNNNLLIKNSCKNEYFFLSHRFDISVRKLNPLYIEFTFYYFVFSLNNLNSVQNIK